MSEINYSVLCLAATNGTRIELRKYSEDKHSVAVIDSTGNLTEHVQKDMDSARLKYNVERDKLFFDL